MHIEREWLEQIVFGTAGARRFTQDSPILPDVWIRYAVEQDPPFARPVDLLFTPHRRASAVELAGVLLERLEAERAQAARLERDGTFEPTGFAYNQTTVVARLHFDELMRCALPLSGWWHEYVHRRGPGGEAPDFAAPGVRARLVRCLGALERAEAAQRGTEVTPPAEDQPPQEMSEWHAPAELLWLVRLAGVLLLAREQPEPADARTARTRFRQLVFEHEAVAARFCLLMAGLQASGPGVDPSLFLVSVNRPAEPTVSLSVLAVKADAARRLFDLSCKQINWAILDSGIDATHPAFRRRRPDGSLVDTRPFGGPAEAGRPPANHTRVAGTWDFTRVRHLLSPDMDRVATVVAGLRRNVKKATDPDERARWQRDLEFWERLAKDPRMLGREAKQLRSGLRSGRSIDWSGLEELLRVPHDASYEAPVHDHGTHVAGVLAADWRPTDGSDDRERQTSELLKGVCPDINVYDMRVLDEQGRGDEFSIIAALQFVRHLNATRDTPILHGVNLSLSIRHDVANYACGRTPVCDEAERLVSSGVVVVVAAGNDGYIQYATPAGSTEGYRSISITDPGNAELVITVGATHRYHPHTYGVSYFSSRGPTGDGRVKPDLVAPGEKIEAPVPNGLQVKDGTSMAAPHVSGAAALLLSRHRELIGQPQRIKQILCATATDLGRERYFQGSGMLDVLRAIQHV